MQPVPIRKTTLAERKRETPNLARKYYRYFRTKGESKEDAKSIVRNIIKSILKD